MLRILSKQICNLSLNWNYRILQSFCLANSFRICRWSLISNKWNIFWRLIATLKLIDKYWKGYWVKHWLCSGGYMISIGRVNEWKHWLCSGAWNVLNLDFSAKFWVITPAPLITVIRSSDHALHKYAGTTDWTRKTDCRGHRSFDAIKQHEYWTVSLINTAINNDSITAYTFWAVLVY